MQYRSHASSVKDMFSGRPFTLRFPLTCQVYKWLLAHENLGGGRGNKYTWSLHTEPDSQGSGDSRSVFVSHDGLRRSYLQGKVTIY